MYFDDFHLPVGSELWFHTPEGKYDQTWSRGPHHGHGKQHPCRWTNDEVPGDELVMVYGCPLGTTEPAALGTCQGLVFLRGITFPPSLGCHHGTRRFRCMPSQCSLSWGDSWECEKDAVVKLRITQGNFVLCSGAMVNNTSLDCRQLMLSSFHCANEVEENRMALLQGAVQL